MDHNTPERGKATTLMLSYLLWLETLDDEEQSVFKRIYEEFGPRLRFLAWNLTHNDADAEDLVSAVLERIMRYKDKFIHANDEEIYRLLVIYARSIHFNKWKKDHRYSISSLDEPLYSSYDKDEVRLLEIEDEDSPSGVEELLTKERNIKIAKIIESLGEPFSQIIFLTYYEDRTSAEVGEILGLKASTVRTMLQKAREKMRVELEVYLYGENH